MPRSDLKNRKWRSPKAEQKFQKDQRAFRVQYWERRNILASVIAETVAQRELNFYLEAPTLPRLLLQLKEEIDRRGKFHARCPHPRCDGDSTIEQSERAMFMKDAFDLARKLGKIKLDTSGDGYLLYVHNPPRWILHRDGQEIKDYLPTKAELTEHRVVESDVEQELTLSGKFHARYRGLLH